MGFNAEPTSVDLEQKRSETFCPLVAGLTCDNLGENPVGLALFMGPAFGWGKGEYFILQFPIDCTQQGRENSQKEKRHRRVGGELRGIWRTTHLHYTHHPDSGLLWGGGAYNVVFWGGGDF